MILEGIVALVAAAPSLAGVRMYPVLLEQGTTLPAITYQIVGGSSMPTFDTSGMQKLRVQFDVFGATYLSATTAREALRALLNGFRGLLPDGSFLQDCELIQPLDQFENDARQFRCGIEFYLWFCFADGSF